MQLLQAHVRTVMTGDGRWGDQRNTLKQRVFAMNATQRVAGIW
jgi:hypothetical protein